MKRKLILIIAGVFCLLMLFGQSSDAFFKIINKTSIIDLRPHLKLHARFLEKSSPAVEWSTIQHAPEMDMIAYISDDRVLVGLIDIEQRYRNAIAFSPINGPYVLFDAKDGKQIWEIPRKKSLSVSYAVVSVKPNFLIAEYKSESTEFLSYDLATGKKVWEKKMPGKVLYAVDEKRGVLIAASPEGAKGISLLEINSGQEKWRINELPVDALSDIWIDDDLAVLSGKGLCALSVHDAKILWRAVPEDMKNIRLISKVNSGYIVNEKSNSLSMLSREGKKLWETKLDGWFVEAVMYGDNIIARTDWKDNTSLIYSMAPKDGRVNWKQATAKAVQSAIKVIDGGVVFTTSDSLELHSLKDGSLLKNTQLAGDGYKKERLSDYVFLFKDHFVVASEYVVSAYDRKTMKADWSLNIPSAEYLFSDTTRWKRVFSKPSGVDDSKASDYSAEILAQSKRTDEAIRGLSRKFDDYIEKGDIESARVTVAQIEMEQSFARLQTTMNLHFMAWEGMFSVATRVQEGADKAAYDRALAAERLSPKIHLKSIQGKYYVRPILWERGAGLIVVNMENGEWTEIPTNGPEGDLSKEHYLNIRMSAVSGDGKKLVTKGTGLDHEKWELDERHLHRSVHRSIIKYDMDTAKFYPAKDYISRSLTFKKSRKK